MPKGRQKFNFYAVTNGRDTGVYTNWTQTGDSVLGFANAKYKGFCSYDEAASAMKSAGFGDFNVFDGHNIYCRRDYEIRSGNTTEKSNKPENEDPDRPTVDSSNTTEDKNDNIQVNDFPTNTDNQIYDPFKIMNGLLYQEKGLPNQEPFLTKVQETRDLGETHPPCSLFDYTPQKKSVSDRSEIPVPGSINGSFVTPSCRPKKVIPKRMQESNTKNNENDKQYVVMKNIELILQAVVSDLHEIRQEQQEFKEEIKDELIIIRNRQQSFDTALSAFETKFSNEIKQNNDLMTRSYNNRQVTTNEHTDIQVRKMIKSEIVNLQQEVKNGFESTKSTIQTLEMPLQMIQVDIEKISDKCNKEFNSLDVNGRRLEESVSGLLLKVNSSKETINDIERSMNAISQNQDFVIPNKSAKQKQKQNVKETVTEVENRFTVIENQQQKDSYISVNDETHQPGSETQRQTTKESDKTNTENKSESRNKDSDENTKTKKNNTETPKYKTKKDMVYLIGDSISAQVNPVLLGKNTYTFVKKMRASKLDNLKELANEIKDAKMVIIHTGINDIREAHTKEDMMKNLLDAITSIKEVTPESKVVISKIIPIGDRKLDIERELFNAESERDVTNIKFPNVSFLDNSNMAERGTPIREYYRNDIVHLSRKGVAVFEENLENIIRETLKIETTINQQKRLEQSTETRSYYQGPTFRSQRKYTSPQPRDQERFRNRDSKSETYHKRADETNQYRNYSYRNTREIRRSISRDRGRNSFYRDSNTRFSGHYISPNRYYRDRVNDRYHGRRSTDYHDRQYLESDRYHKGH